MVNKLPYYTEETKQHLALTVILGIISRLANTITELV